MKEIARSSATSFQSNAQHAVRKLCKTTYPFCLIVLASGCSGLAEFAEAYNEYYEQNPGASALGPNSYNAFQPSTQPVTPATDYSNIPVQTFTKPYNPGFYNYDYGY